MREETAMNEDRLDELLDDAKRTWLQPPEPDHQAMWGRIEREAFGGARRVSRAPSWRIYSIGLAATLVMGVALGRFSMKADAPANGAAVQGDSAIESPASAYDKAATELLGRTVVLLTSLPSAQGVGRAERFSTQ